MYAGLETAFSQMGALAFPPLQRMGMRLCMAGLVLLSRSLYVQRQHWLGTRYHALS